MTKIKSKIIFVSMYLSRRLGFILSKSLSSFPSVLITGPRQSGKTTFARAEQGSQMKYVNFDDPLQQAFATEDPRGFVKGLAGQAVILDEIQHVPKLLTYLKMDIDEKRSHPGRWLLTGSQQFGLMRSINESLAGRIAILELPPFSLPEVKQRDLPHLGSIIWKGLYPEPYLEPDKLDIWIQSYVRTYIERDVRQIQNIQDLRTFQHFLALCAASHGQILSMASLSRDAGISQPTVKQWLSVLEASYICVMLPPYFSNLGKRITKSPKLYFLDPALACFLTRQPGPDAALAGNMGGALLEGLIVTEAIKAFMARGKRPEVYFWRSHDGLEVDLLLSVKGRILPVEIKLTATPTTRHLDPLNKFKKIAGKCCLQQGLLICDIEQKTALPHDNIALPWFEFSDHLAELLD
ncbi:MAG: ATP-binding protein [Desulfohalobiaceae bacterium]|nr:ATP-binding protein [Desulfohalobiaceae bacterium]